MGIDVMIKISVLGSTGSIGKSTLDVISRHPDKYQIYALTANTNIDILESQCNTFKPVYAVLFDEAAAGELTRRFNRSDLTTKVLTGIEGLNHVASLDEVDYVVAGIVGAAGLMPTLAAVKAGKRVLLANKEALVMSGKLMIDAVSANNATLLPVDSEHNAIFQCIPNHQLDDQYKKQIRKIMLTASGGPFRTMAIDELEHVTPEQAVAHPNWEMGHKISVDSATMMNKGLELIEAVWLFDIPIDDIEVVIHPQSVIHSMVSYVDGSVLAQLGNPDMRTPIAHALAWPERIESGVEPLDIFDVAKLEFEKPDLTKFPCLRLCYEAIQRGGTASIILNAANEVAVEAFLNKTIPFTAISKVIEQTLNDAVISDDVSTMDLVIEADEAARLISQQLINKYHQ